VTITDTTPPVLTCATNKTVECGATWNFDEPSASDVCCGTNLMLTVLSTVTNGDTCQAIITRTWQATDCCTNSATCSQSVTNYIVVTNLLPVLTVSLSNDLAVLTWISVPGRTNFLEYNDDLGGTNWIVLTNVIGTGSLVDIPDGPISNQAQRYYRVRVQ